MNRIKNIYKNMHADKKRSILKAFIDVFKENGDGGLLVFSILIYIFIIMPLLVGKLVACKVLGLNSNGKPAFYMYCCYFVWGFFASIIIPVFFVALYTIKEFFFAVSSSIAVSYKIARVPLTVEEIAQANCKDIWEFAELLKHMTSYHDFCSKERYAHKLKESIRNKISKAYFQAAKENKAFALGLDTNVKSVSEKKALSDYIRDLLAIENDNAFSLLLDFLTKENVTNYSFTEKEVTYVIRKEKKKKEEKCVYRTETAVFSAQINDTETAYLIRYPKYNGNSAYKIVYTSLKNKTLE